MSAPSASSPLHATALRVSTAVDHLDVRPGLPARATDDSWTRCSDVDRPFLTTWEARIAEDMSRDYGRADPIAVSGFALDRYAGIPGQVGGALFRLARRVPRLDRAALAFTCGTGEGQYPVAIALLDDRFWCLPADADAAHPSATVADGTASLAAELRAQVRAHADGFLAGYRPGRRTSPRGLLGAFFDGLDTGIWFGGDDSAAAASQVIADARAVLPGGTADFRHRSSLYVLADTRGREHLCRRRVGVLLLLPGLRRRPRLHHVCPHR